MFEYITLVLQVIFVVIVIVYTGKILFFTGLAVYRDHLWVRLTGLEYHVVKKRSNGSIIEEHADYLLEYMQKLRHDFYMPEPRDSLSAIPEILEKSVEISDDLRIVVFKILVIQFSFLATKSIVALIVVLTLKAMVRKSKNAGKISVRRDNLSPIADTAPFIQALFSNAQPQHV